MNKNNIENKIPIFFACDNNYAPFVTVVLESIIENSSKEYIYEIYILNNNISDEYKEIIAKHEPNAKVEEVERFAYYERAKKAYAVLQTGETAIYANIILQKGVVIND